MAQAQFDLRNVTSCAERLRLVLQAYETVIGGQQRTVVRFQERWTEYQKGNAEELRNYYITLYNQCPDAARAGLPDLNPAARVRRGPPTRPFSRSGCF